MIVTVQLVSPSYLGSLILIMKHQELELVQWSVQVSKILWANKYVLEHCTKYLWLLKSGKGRTHF